MVQLDDAHSHSGRPFPPRCTHCGSLAGRWRCAPYHHGRIRGGLERVYSEKEDRPVAHISGGGGYSWQLLDDGAVYTLLTGRLEANSTFTTWIEPSLGAAAGGLYHSKIGTGRMEFNGEQFAGGEYRLQFSFIQNLALSRDNAFQFKFKREWHSDRDFSEIGLNFNHFF